MTTKEYLGQAYRIDQRINSKLEQMHSLRELATKASSILREGAAIANRNVQSMEETIAKIIDLETEINHDIDQLVDIKREIVSVIKRVQNPEYQALLELRYISCKTWEQIAAAMFYSIQNVYKLHNRALIGVSPLVPRE